MNLTKNFTSIAAILFLLGSLQARADSYTANGYLFTGATAVTCTSLPSNTLANCSESGKFNGVPYSFGVSVYPYLSGPTDQLISMDWQTSGGSSPFFTLGFTLSITSLNPGTYSIIPAGPYNLLTHLVSTVNGTLSFSLETSVAANSSGNETFSIVPASSIAVNRGFGYGSNVNGNGVWSLAYGAKGFVIEGDPNNPAIPSFVTFTPPSLSTPTWTWATGIVEPSAALQYQLNSVLGLATCWYSKTSFSAAFNFTDGNAHEVAFYLLDADTNARAESIEFYDYWTGALLGSTEATEFHSGVYSIWKLQGYVVVKITNNNSGSNAVLSGIFFDN